MHELSQEAIEKVLKSLKFTEDDKTQEQVLMRAFRAVLDADRKIRPLHCRKCAKPQQNNPYIGIVC